MSGKGRLVRKFRHFFAKFWYILEIFAKFCLIKPSFAKFPFIYSIFRLFGITDLLTKSKFWPKHTFAGAPRPQGVGAVLKIYRSARFQVIKPAARNNQKWSARPIPDHSKTNQNGSPAVTTD